MEGNTADRGSDAQAAKRQALAIGTDPVVGVLLRAALEPDEWSIHNAPDNGGALRLAEAMAFELIVTDQNTRGEEDIEFLRKIRRMHPHTRVIILTGEATPSEIIGAMREHAFSFFSKPVCLDALGSIISQVTQGPSWDDGIELVSATPQWIRLTVRSDMETANRLLQFLREIVVLPEYEAEAVGAALRELLFNAIEHGAKFDREKYVEVSYLRTKHAIACRIKDPGEGFSMSELSHAAIANPPEDPVRHVTFREAANLRPGGFGILLASGLIDELIYSEQGNDVVLVKNVEIPNRDNAERRPEIP